MSFTKNIPNEQIWEQIKTDLEVAGRKIIMLEKATWHNALTRQKQETYDIPLYAGSDCSGRPYAITRIIVIVPPEPTVNSISTSHSAANNQIDAYYNFNDFYSHINISSSNDIINTIPILNEEGKIIRWYQIKGQAICSPITQHHFYTTPEKELKLIMKGQLTGQNKNSAFQQVASISNNTRDYGIKYQGTGAFIKKSTSPLCLLTRQTADTLRTMSSRSIFDYLEANVINFHLTDAAYIVKRKQDNIYSCVTNEEYNNLLRDGELSGYYEAFPIDILKDLLDNIPKDEIDFACLGLGSAGTGVLDLLSRSTFFDTYLLVDNDTVEEKNLRNQWYTTGNVGYSKAAASTSAMKVRSYKIKNIVTKGALFQDAGMKMFNMKYTMGAFDSLEARMELYKQIKDGIITTKYLIDARYEDLSSSIYFIDTSKPEEMDYYERNLIADKQAFDEQEAAKPGPKQVETDDELIAWLEENSAFVDKCVQCTEKIAGTGIHCSASGDCNGNSCHNRWIHLFHTFNPKLYLQKGVSSCVKQNFIDIYKYTSSFIFAAIREIEDGNTKPFTYIEAQTDRLPSYAVIRK